MIPATISGKFGRLPAMIYVEYNHEGDYMAYTAYVTGYEKYKDISGSGRTLYHSLASLSERASALE